MFNRDQIDSLAKDILSRLSGNDPESGCSSKGGTASNGGQHSSGTSKDAVCKNMLTPSKVLVIAGLLANVLSVNSILVDRDQALEIRLIGSLKVKTDLDRMLDKIGPMPLDDVLRAFMDRLL